MEGNGLCAAERWKWLAAVVKVGPAVEEGDERLWFCFCVGEGGLAGLC